MNDTTKPTAIRRTFGIPLLIKSIIIDYYLPIIQQIKLMIHKFKWKKLNKHNKTIAKCLFPLGSVFVGKHTYGYLDIKFFGNPSERISIGNFCSIANDVKFLLGGGHTYTHLSTYPFKRLIGRLDIIEATTKGPIIVCDDVWIGYGTIILSGVTIGQGVVIGAGSVVAKDIPPYAIYVGTKVIKYRFKQEVIDRLIALNFGKLDEIVIKENMDLLYSEIDDAFFDNELWKRYSGKPGSQNVGESSE